MTSANSFFAISYVHHPGAYERDATMTALLLLLYLHYTVLLRAYYTHKGLQYTTFIYGSTAIFPEPDSFCVLFDTLH